MGPPRFFIVPLKLLMPHPGQRLEHEPEQPRVVSRRRFSLRKQGQRPTLSSL